MPRYKLDFKSFPSLWHNVQPVQLYIHISKMKIRIAGWQKNPKNFNKMSYGTISPAAGWIKLVYFGAFTNIKRG